MKAKQPSKKSAPGASAAPKQRYTATNSLISYYLVIMFGFFPLFLTNKYVHARTDKFWLFLILTLILTAAVAVTTLISRSEDKRTGVSSPLFRPISTPDVMMLCFFGFAAVSTIFSAHFADALTGIAARDNGLLLLLMYLLMYLILTRGYQYKDYVMAIYLVGAGIVAALAVLNFFYIDPFGILTGYDAATIEDFGSTIGNKNTIAAFMCLYLPAAVMMFVVTEKRYLRALGAAAIILAYAGLLCANSSSDILGLMVILPVMAIFCARSYTYLRRYLLALTILFASGKLLQLFSALCGDNSKGFEFIQAFLIYSPVMLAPIAVCGVAYLLMRLCGKNGVPGYPAKAIRILFTALFAAGVVTVVSLFLYYSVSDTVTDLGRFEKLLRFNDAWGTHRGYMWRVSLEEYAKFNLFGLLFGSGPDTLYYVFEPHFAELLARFGDAATDCAHNEYINYLVTQGALGLAAYLGLMTATIVRGLKTAKTNPVALVFISAVICYLAQATVNLYSPITTPMLFIFIALTEALNRQARGPLGAAS